jgi:dTMP kinase
MSTSGRLIVFEGADGAGKSSISSYFLAAVRGRGVAVELLSFPGKQPNTLGELVYRLHHKPEELGVSSLTPASLQTLHIAAHLDAIESVIVPALEAGSWIVLDRYWWSTWVYGIVDGIRRDVLSALIEAERLVWGKWLPAAVFHVTRKQPLREEPLAKWRRLRAAYEELARIERDKYPIYTLHNESAPETALAKAVRRIGFHQS